MNERIRLLAEQAGLQPFEDCGPGYVYKMGKFAELIVTECAMFVVVELEGQIGSLIADRTARRLEEHFGVEE